MTPEKRLELIPRVASLLRDAIERNGYRYDGRLVPNLQAIIDLATVDAQYLVGAEDALVALERERAERDGL